MSQSGGKDPAYVYLLKLFNALTVLRHHKLAMTFAKLVQVLIY